MRLFHWLKGLLMAGLVSGLAACGGGSDNTTPNFVDLARADARFSVLAEAIEAADLTGTLTGPGPYTVFAPTDAAFNALLAELQISKAQLLANNEKTYWVPSYVKEKRFHNWLENARDWVRPSRPRAGPTGPLPEPRFGGWRKVVSCKGFQKGPRRRGRAVQTADCRWRTTRFLRRANCP